MPGHVQPFISFGTDLTHVFFAIKNKGCKGTIEDAENQCIRTGAALVHARRELNRRANDVTERCPSAAVHYIDPNLATPGITGLATPPASASTATAPDYDSF